MKKVITGILGIILMCGLALAANGMDGQANTISPSSTSTMAVGQQQDAPAGEGVTTTSQIQNRVKTGSYQVNGNQLMIQEKANNRIQLRVQNISADCDCNLTEEFDPVQNRTKLKITLSNGRNAEVKIMPDVASETALARLRLNNCDESNNCSIELKEVGEGSQTRAAYEVKARKTFKIFGLFKNQEQVQTQIDAETGEEIASKRPWWAWLASEEDEANENEKLMVCPEAWYDNQMPTISEGEEITQYLVIGGKRKELADYDIDWIKENCEVNEPEIVQ